MEPNITRAAGWFYATLALFGAWVVALGILAYTTAENPRRINEPAPIDRQE